MKYIKNFMTLNESYQDGLDIIDAIKNSPEGKDLLVIVSSGRQDFNLDRMFELKRTGRIWFHGGGSKTFIERQGGLYCFESISQGKYFGRECYPTIKECLRGLWTNVMGKRSTTLGIKKDDFRQWIDTNIAPGRGLDINDISNEYLKSKGQAIPDLSQIPNTPFFKMIGNFFKVNYRAHHQSERYYYLDIDVTNPFGANVCNLVEPPATHYPLIAQNSIEAKATGKSRFASNGRGGIILCDSNNLEKDFRNLFVKWFAKLISTERPDWTFVNLEALVKRTGSNSDGPCTDLYQILNAILEVFKDKNINFDAGFSLDNIIDSIRIKSPIAFAKIIKGMEKSGLHPEITKKYRDEHSDIIKGASMMDRFGLRGKKDDI